jgi:hypothetical protein
MRWPDKFIVTPGSGAPSAPVTMPLIDAGAAVGADTAGMFRRWSLLAVGLVTVVYEQAQP